MGFGIVKIVKSVQPKVSFFLGRTHCLFLRCCGKPMERVTVIYQEFEGDYERRISCCGRCTECQSLAGHLWIPSRIP